jgi:hypothetical protein
MKRQAKWVGDICIVSRDAWTLSFDGAGLAKDPN